MDGKDLFLALGQVQDEFITEAETYAGRRVISMHSVRWVGALAACICLLIGWAVAAQWTDNPLQTLFSAGSSNEAALEEATTETAEEAATTEGGYAADIAEAEEETGVDYSESGDSARGALPTEAPEKTENTQYVILAAPFAGAKSDTEVLYDEPQNGRFILDAELKNTLEQCALAEFTGLPRFLVAFDLYRDEVKIDPDSEEYAAEIERLSGLGYAFRTLSVEHRDKSLKVQVCGLLTEEQLADFDASEDYGYFFYFPENEDGTPLDWEDAVDLPGKTQQD